MTDATHSPARLMVARRELEQLAKECLSAATTAAFIRAGSDPDRIDISDIGRIAVRMAFSIREEVGKRIDGVLSSEGADAYLEKLAMTMSAPSGDG